MFYNRANSKLSNTKHDLLIYINIITSLPFFFFLLKEKADFVLSLH